MITNFFAHNGTPTHIVNKSIFIAPAQAKKKEKRKEKRANAMQIVLQINKIHSKIPGA